jgi:hypothetical protein
MSGVSVQQLADRVSELMEERLRLKGRTLGEKVARGGRVLPRKVRSSAAYLAEAADHARVPRMLGQLDHQKISEAYDACLRYLRPIGAGERRRSMVLSALVSAATAVLAAAALVLIVLVWRGYV